MARKRKTEYRQPEGIDLFFCWSGFVAWWAIGVWCTWLVISFMISVFHLADHVEQHSTYTSYPSIHVGGGCVMDEDKNVIRCDI